MTKVLMVGHGAFAEKHMDGIKNIPGVEVVSICGRREDATVEERIIGEQADVAAAAARSQYRREKPTEEAGQRQRLRALCDRKLVLKVRVSPRRSSAGAGVVKKGNIGSLSG